MASGKGNHLDVDDLHIDVVEDKFLQTLQQQQHVLPGTLGVGFAATNGNHLSKESLLGPPHGEAPLGSSDITYREKLLCEYNALTRKHVEVQESESVLQAELSTEMIALRDHCHEQGQAVGLLTHRLAEAHEAVNMELANAVVVRQAIESELMTEAAVRQDLQLNIHEEQAELRSRITASEKQLAVMQGVKASLQEQVEAIEQRQAKLCQEIEEEKLGRAELHGAGVRELDAWKDHNVRLGEELRCQLAELQEEEENWRAEWSIEVLQLEDREQRQGRLESILRVEVADARSQEQDTMVRYESEAIMWSRYVGELREQLAHRETVCKEEDAENARVEAERLEYDEAHSRLAEEFQACETQLMEDEAQVEASALQSKTLREELKELERSLKTVRQDGELLRLESERQLVEHELQVARQEQARLEELKAKSSAFSCLKRRREPPKG